MQQDLELKRRLEEVIAIVMPFSKMRIMGGHLDRFLLSCRSQRGYLQQHLQEFEYLEGKLQGLAEENTAIAIHLMNRPPGFAKANREARAVIARIEDLEATIETQMRADSEALRAKTESTITAQQQLGGNQVHDYTEKVQSGCEKEQQLEFGSRKKRERKASVWKIKVYFELNLTVQINISTSK